LTVGRADVGRLLAYTPDSCFIYLSMTLLDFVAGFIITTLSARRDTVIESSM